MPDILPNEIKKSVYSVGAFDTSTPSLPLVYSVTCENANQARDALELVAERFGHAAAMETLFDAKGLVRSVLVFGTRGELPDGWLASANRAVIPDTSFRHEAPPRFKEAIEWTLIIAGWILIVAPVTLVIFGLVFIFAVPSTSSEAFGWILFPFVVAFPIVFLLPLLGLAVLVLARSSN